MGHMKGLRIGELAAESGFSAPTIRYYESIGLLKAPARLASGYRTYSERTVKELGLVRRRKHLDSIWEKSRRF